MYKNLDCVYSKFRRFVLDRGGSKYIYYSSVISYIMSSLLGIVLAFCSAFFKSSKSITTKLATAGTNSYLTSFATRLMGVPIFIFLVIVANQYMIPEDIDFWYALVINSILLSISTIFFAKALQLSDVSIISPIMALLPIGVTIPAFFLLNEIPSISAGLGLVLVGVGAYTLNINVKKYGYFEPLKRLSEKGVQFAFLGIIFASIIPSVDKIGIQASNPFLWVLAIHIGSSLLLGLIVVIICDEFKKPIQNNFKVLVGVGIASSLIWVFQSYAYLYTQVAYVQAIKRVSILLSVGAGYYLFNEKHIKERFTGAFLMMIGIILIVVGL